MKRTSALPLQLTAFIYKELERILYKEKSNLSIKKAAELTHNMYQITYTLPESKHTKTKLLKMDEHQAELYQIVEKNFSGVATLKTGGFTSKSLGILKSFSVSSFFKSTLVTSICRVRFLRIFISYLMARPCNWFRPLRLVKLLILENLMPWSPAEETREASSSSGAITVMVALMMAWVITDGCWANPDIGSMARNIRINFINDIYVKLQGRQGIEMLLFMMKAVVYL